MRHIFVIFMSIAVVIVANSDFDIQRGKRRTVAVFQVIANEPVKTHKGKRKPQEISCTY